MKESKQKRNRKCRQCVNVIYGDASRMRQHEKEHLVIQRAVAAGLVIPKSSLNAGKIKGVLV